MSRSVNVKDGLARTCCAQTPLGEREIYRRNTGARLNAVTQLTGCNGRTAGVIRGSFHEGAVPEIFLIATIAGMEARAFETVDQAVASSAG